MNKKCCSYLNSAIENLEIEKQQNILATFKLQYKVFKDIWIKIHKKTLIYVIIFYEKRYGFYYEKSIFYEKDYSKFFEKQ